MWFLRIWFSIVISLMLSACISAYADWRVASRKDTISSYESFLRMHPKSTHTRAAALRLEDLRWKEILSDGNSSDFRKFLDLYPNSRYYHAAQERLEALLWKTAQAEDSEDGYFAFIDHFPMSQHYDEAEMRIEQIQVATSKISIDYPKVVSPQPSPYSNIDEPVYRWHTIFKDLSNDTGFTLSAKSRYVVDAEGQKWLGTWFKTVEVGPGGSARYTHTCICTRWAGGAYYVVWAGSNGRGISVQIVQEVKLGH